MQGDTPAESGYVAREEHIFRLGEKARKKTDRKDERVVPRPGYLVELSGEPIPLEAVEFKILTFLAKRPYRAFSRRQIAIAVSSAFEAVAETDIDRHVQSLRDKLGLFSDYIQSVPYVGYRFKE